MKRGVGGSDGHVSRPETEREDEGETTAAAEQQQQLVAGIPPTHPGSRGSMTPKSTAGNTTVGNSDISHDLFLKRFNRSMSNRITNMKTTAGTAEKKTTGWRSTACSPESGMLRRIPRTHQHPTSMGHEVWHVTCVG